MLLWTQTGSTQQFPTQPPFLPPLSSSLFIFFSLGISMCPISVAARPWRCVDDLWRTWCPLPAPVQAVASSKLLLSKLFFMLYSHCCIISIPILSIRSGVFVFVFCLPLSLLSLSCLSLSFSSLTRPTLSRMVPSCKPGPAQGFFLLKESFFLPLCLPGGSGPGFLTL